MSGRVKGIVISLVVLLLGVLTIGCSQAPESTNKEVAMPRAEKSAKEITVDPGKYFSSEQAKPKEKRAELNLSASVENFTGAKDIKMWIPCPKTTEYQAVSDVKVDGNFAKQGFYKDKDGNKILYAEWRSPQDKPNLSLTFKVARKEINRKNFPSKEKTAIPADIKEKYLSAIGLVVTDGEPKKIAEEITKGKKPIFSKAEAIYDYIVENYKRDDMIKGCGRGDVCQLVVTKQGKCADISSVFVSFARSVGVPAREIFGIRTKSEPEGNITDAYHCRAEFYMPGYGWVPVDPSDVLKKMLKENLSLDNPKIKEARDYFFGAQNETYIDLSSGRDLMLNPPQKAGRLNYFMYPYCEINGRAMDYLSQKDFKYTVTYKKI